MRGSFEQNDAYISKEGSVIELGEKPSKNGVRKDFDEACALVLAGQPVRTVALEYPKLYVRYNRGFECLRQQVVPAFEADGCRGVWVYGPPGYGKSKFVRDTYNDIYIKAQNKWFDGYNGQETILLDDYDCGSALSHYFKIWMDRYACTGEIKGGTVNLQHRDFVVTSNYSIDEMVSDAEARKAIKRRCTVIYFHEKFEYIKLSDRD